MNLTPYLGSYLVSSLIAGLLGGAAMLGAMWLMTRGGLSRGNMVYALGGLLTKSRQNAFRAGLLAHMVSAVVFALLYALLMFWAGGTGPLPALLIGLGAGFFHGLVVSLMLVWVVAEGHPFEEYNEAGLAVGLAHVLGHVVYGVVVGLVVGVSPF